MAVQGFYNRVNTHVAVKATRLSSTSMLEPGKVLKPGDLRIFHMRSLFKRRCIGIQNTPWVDAQLIGLNTKKIAKTVQDIPDPEVVPEKTSPVIPPVVKAEEKTKTVVKKESKPKAKKSGKITKPWEHGNN